MFTGTFTATRKSTFAVTNEVLPMILITLFSLTAPFVNADVFDMRITIASIGLLTIMGFMFVVQASLPPVGYMTWMMYMAMVSFGTTFLISAECVFIHFLDPQGWAVIGQIEEEWKTVNMDHWSPEEKERYLAKIEEDRKQFEAFRKLRRQQSAGDASIFHSRRNRQGHNLAQCGLFTIRQIYSRTVDYNTLDPTSVKDTLKEIVRIDNFFRGLFPIAYCVFVAVFTIYHQAILPSKDF